MSMPNKRPLQQYCDFVATLRERGITNFFAMRPYLQAEFELTSPEVRRILINLNKGA